MTDMSGRLLIVGPLPPLRGGIPRHTERMSLALSKSWNVEVLSPKKLYPDWLYPGESQFEQREPLNLECCRIISKSKVFLLLRLLSQKQIPENVIIVWWNIYLAPFTYIAARIAKVRGSKVVFFCHNVFPHDSRKLERRLTQFVLGSADAFAVQSREELLKLKRIREVPIINLGKPSSFSDLAEIGNSYSETSTGLTFLAIGLVRKYKNIPLLIDAFKQVQGSQLRLRIVGECWDKKLKEIIHLKASNDKRIELNLNFVSEEEFLKEISSATYVCLPYLSATGSAILATSLGFGKPVIVSNIDAFTEVVEEGRNGLIFQSNDVRSLVATLQRSVNTFTVARSGDDPQGPGWADLAKAFTDFLRRN